jgi:hypothetical protein
MKFQLAAILGGLLLADDNHLRDLEPLRGLQELREDHFSNRGSRPFFGGNKIRDLSPLAGAEHLQMAAGEFNEVTDLSPLRRAFRQGGFLNLRGNGLETEGGSATARLIEEWRTQSNPVFVDDQAQRSPWNWELDPALEAVLRQQLGLASGQDFLPWYHQWVTVLLAPEAGIRSLRGLERARRLQRLEVPDNAIRRQQIFDARFGAKTMEVQDGKFRVRWSVEGSEDLQQWEEVEAFETEVILPEKIFLRLAPRDSLSDP